MLIKLVLVFIRSLTVHPCLNYTFSHLVFRAAHNGVWPIQVLFIFKFNPSIFYN